MFVDAGGGATKKRCILILQRAGSRPVAVGTRQIDVSMAMGVQQTGDKPMAICTQYSGDDLDTRSLHPSQQKMTKRQRTGITPMVAGTWHGDFSPSAKTNLYLK